MTRHLFILNPAAGRRDITPAIKQNIQRLKLRETYDVYVTDSVGAAARETERYIKAYPDDFIRIYACGGDGTLSEVVNGMYASGSRNCAVGVVPVGSGNDFVKNFDIPPEQFRELRNQLRGDVADIDLLLATDETGKELLSLNIVSAGYDAAVAKGQQKFKKLPLVSGSAAYNMSLVKCLFSSMKHYFNVLVDDKPCAKSGDGPYLFALAANGKFYGGGFKASPYSDISDGYLDFIRIDTVSRPKFLSLVGKFRAGRHIDEFKDIVTYSRAKKMQIVSKEPVDLNLDGEIHEMRNPTVSILPSAIKMIIPKPED